MLCPNASQNCQGKIYIMVFSTWLGNMGWTQLEASNLGRQGKGCWSFLFWPETGQHHPEKEMLFVRRSQFLLPSFRALTFIMCFTQPLAPGQWSDAEGRAQTWVDWWVKQVCCCREISLHFWAFFLNGCRGTSMNRLQRGWLKALSGISVFI